MYNSNNRLLKQTKEINDCALVTMEIDLRSKEEKKRTLRYFINNVQLMYYFTNLPSKVKFAVCCLWWLW